MSAPTVFPQLRSGARLKRFRDYVLLYLNPALTGLIHPSHALLLSLCTGRHSQGDLAYLMGETYRMAPGEGGAFVDGLLARFRPFLRFLDGPDPTAVARYEPRDFLFNVDGSVLQAGRDDPIPVPIGINLNLTFACNFRCRYCYQVVSGDGHGRLDLGKCLELVDEAAAWGVACVGMTGGEPTLFPGWLTLLEAILARDLAPVFTSNGSVIGRSRATAQQLRAMGLEEMTISLDASNAALHGAITGSPGSFEAVVNAIRYLRDAGIRVGVKHVLTSLNAADVAAFLDLVAGLGVAEVGITYMEAGAPGSNANVLPRLTTQQLASARETVLARREALRGTCEVRPPRDGSCRWDDRDWYPCGGLYMGMSIFPSGQVAVCDKLATVEQFHYGNVYEGTLREIWEGERFREIRARAADPSLIDGECARCGWLRICRTGCFVDSYAATGDYLAKHPCCDGPFTVAATAVTDGPSG